MFYNQLNDLNIQPSCVLQRQAFAEAIEQRGLRIW